MKQEPSELRDNINLSYIINLRQQMQKLDSDNAENILELLRNLFISEPNVAYDILNDALSRTFKHTSPALHLKLHLFHSEILKFNGAYQDAFNILNEAKKLHSHNFWPLIYLAKLESDQYNYEKALSLVADAADKFGNQENSHVFFKEYATIIEKIIDIEFPIVNTSIEGEPIYNVLLAYLIKDEEDVISQNLCHHYKIGFRNFVIMDNNSSDNTVDLINAFKIQHPDTNLIILNDTIIGYNQAVKTNSMSQYAISMFNLLGINTEWILPVDADEFFIPCPQLNMKSLFDRALKEDNKIISFSWNNAATSDINSIIARDEDLFKRFNLRLKKTDNHVFKVATRVIEGNEFIQGNHATTMSFKFLNDIMPASKYGCFILHLHMRNLAHMKKKVVNGGIAALNANVEIAPHWKENYKQFLNKGDAAIIDILEKYILIFKNHGYDINTLK
jgi:hypothetical protein